LYAGDTDSKEISSDQQLIIEQLKKEQAKPYRKDILIATMLKLAMRFLEKWLSLLSSTSKPV
jgi:hypothetical protein